jgi:2'-5' RNA ligase
VRLFVAVFPDAAVNAAVDAVLARALRAGPHGGRWRPVAASRRHVTLRFLADADPDVTVGALRHDLAGLPAPELTTAGAGVFGTALWLGVRAADPEAWTRLVAASGADPAEHVAHLTVARARGRAPEVPPGLAGYRGPGWTAGEVALVASGEPYRVVERFPLVGRSGGGEAVGPAR